MQKFRLILLMICLSAACLCGCDGEKRSEDRIFDDEAVTFFKKLDIKALRTTAAQYGDRQAGALDSLATDRVIQITGSEEPEGVPATAAYLEFYFNAGKYLNRPVILVKSKKLRKVVGANLSGKHLEIFKRTGHIPPVTIMLGSGDSVSNLAKHNQYFNEIMKAGRISDSEAQAARPIGTLGDRWGSLLEREALRVLMGRLSGRYDAFMGIELRLMPGVSSDPVDPMKDILPDADRDRTWPRAGEFLVASEDSLDPERGLLIVKLRDAWKARDAAAVNDVVSQISKVASGSYDYPSQSRLHLELLYNDADKGHPAFIGFVAAFVMFIVAIATGSGAIRKGAMAVMTLSTLAIGGAWILRWIVGGEAWYLPPMMTQYGALVSSAVLAAVLAIIIELFRKYNYIALAAAFYAAVVLVWVYFGNSLFPGTVDSSVGGVRGILKHSLMIVHVSVIVVGHALAGMTIVTSVAYVVIACFKGLDGKSPSSPPGLFGPVGDSPLAAADRCNLILAQAACWTLIVGTLLGAWWADDAWSRWWGWDPKETWALITCLFFVAVLHLRLAAPSRSRGLLTALACIFGGAAMLFNWFAVNYWFSGLHSYG